MTIGYITPQQAAERLRALGMRSSPERIREGIKQGVYPFGRCIVMGKSEEFEIYPRLFDEWIESVARE